MKKTFYQLGIGNIFWNTALVGFSLACLYMAARCIKVIIECITDFGFVNMLRIIGLAILLLFHIVLILMIMWTIVKSGHNRVIYHEHRFFITGELYNEEIAEQCKDEIDIRSIKNVKYLLTHRNSKKKGYSSTPLEFFEFTLSDGSRKCMLISYFSRIQRKKILTIINNEIGSEYTYKNLSKVNYLMNRKKKRSS